MDSSSSQGKQQSQAKPRQKSLAPDDLVDDVETLKRGVLALYDLLGEFGRWNGANYTAWVATIHPMEEIHKYEEALKACRKEVSAASREATRVYLSRNTDDHTRR